MEFQVSQALIGGIISLLITAFFVHMAAKIVVGKGRFLQAIVVAFLGNILSGLVLLGAGLGLLGVFLALAAWALVAAVVYRERWLAGAGIGFVAWILWIAVQFLVSFVRAALAN